MTLTINSPWHCGTEITEDQFVAEIRRRGALTADNPVWRGVDPEAAARRAYRLITAYPDESAELWLEIPQHEHTWGKNTGSVLHRNDTASVTNARSVRLKRLRRVEATKEPPMAGTYQIVRDSERKSDYVRYANAVDSFEDGVERVRDPNYAYKDAHTIAEVIAVFAPGDDANDPEGYAQAVANGINATRARYAGQEPTMQPPSGWKPPEIIRSIIKWDASNRPHQLLNGGSWDFITTHNTGNPNAGANAAMHAAWMHNLGKAGAEEPSWHYTVDEAVIYQHMEDDWAGYHASDNTGPGNFDSLGIELVEIGNLTLVIWNAAWLVAKKMKERGKTDIAAVVKQHNHFARDGKNCPRLLRANNGARWNEYLAAIGYFLGANAQPEPAPTPDKLILPGQGSESPDVFPPNAGLQHGFKGVYLALGAAKYPDDPALGILSLTGWAKEDEWQSPVDGCVYQRFHRVTLQYDPRNQQPWNIVQMHPDTPLPERKAA